MCFRYALGASALSMVLFAQEPVAPPADSTPAETSQRDAGLKTERGKAEASRPGEYVIPPGTKVPLSMINSVSTKSAGEGDRIYLETVFPIISGGRVVIPPGS